MLSSFKEPAGPPDCFGRGGEWEDSLLTAPLERELSENGWVAIRAPEGAPDDLPAAIGAVAGRLGRAVSGRGSRTRELIRPTASGAAHPRSLSARHGYGALPLHVELSHRPRPCRYVILGCLESGDGDAATLLVHRETLQFSANERRLLQDAPIFVRNGRRSFYSTVLSADEAFMRYDRACIEPVDRRGGLALDLVAERLQAAEPLRHAWRPGGLLIFDNWRMFHGRDAVTRNDRSLMRMLIDG